jgi:hypothetical protein
MWKFSIIIVKTGALREGGFLRVSVDRMFEVLVEPALLLARVHAILMGNMKFSKR